MSDTRIKELYDDPEDLDPQLAIRRITDRCFFEVEERVPGGYILEGIYIPEADVAEVRSLKVQGPERPSSIEACRPRVGRIKA